PGLTAVGSGPRLLCSSHFVRWPSTAENTARPDENGPPDTDATKDDGYDARPEPDPPPDAAATAPSAVVSATAPTRQPILTHFVAFVVGLRCGTGGEEIGQ